VASISRPHTAIIETRSTGRASLEIEMYLLPYVQGHGVCERSPDARSRLVEVADGDEEVFLDLQIPTPER
jgi:hypothetical protein